MGYLKSSAFVVYAFVVTPAGLSSGLGTSIAVSWVIIIMWLIIKELIGDDEAKDFLDAQKKRSK